MELKDFKIYIDPGHGAGDPGTEHNGIREHDVNIQVGNKVARLLESCGAIVKLRDVSDPKFRGTNPGCFNIAKDSINWGANIFLSIHCNALSGNTSGTETFTQRGSKASDYEKDLAQRIHQGVINALGTKDLGVRECNYNVFNNQTAWCVLTELATLSNKNDADLLKDNSKLEEVSESIVQAISSFIYANFRNIEKL